MSSIETVIQHVQMYSMSYCIVILIVYIGLDKGRYPVNIFLISL